ncbi:MAG: Tim44/TimA family putative adaptor protein [Litoreibacter sp.]
MGTDMIQLLVLAGIAVFLVIKLKNVLGTREGFEKPQLPLPGAESNSERNRQKFEVIEGGVDHDIVDHAPEGSKTAKALATMKAADENFFVSDFMGGASGAYEMILMAFENGDLDEVMPFLSKDVYDSFQEVIDQRTEQNVIVEAKFVGISEVKLVDASLDENTKEGELKVRYIGELTSVVRDAAGDIIEGNPNEVKKQKDVWTFARVMGADDPNWQLVATGE